MFTVKRLWIKRSVSLYEEWVKMLAVNDLFVDDQLDETYGLYDGERLIGTASIHRNIIKCVSILPEFKGQGLLSQLVTYLLRELHDREIYHVFVYTKPSSVSLFKGIGFKLIAETPLVAFLEMGQPEFKMYLSFLEKVRKESSSVGAIVMNANPFTKGHRYLVEKSLESCSLIYIFVVSEDVSRFSLKDRLIMVKEGVSDLANVIVIPTEDYQVSSATFPSYFLKNRANLELAKVQAALDATVFKNKIAKSLEIKTRFVGQEPFSPVTDIYNKMMADVFADEIELIEIPRLKIGETVISATNVRNKIEQGNLALVKQWVPESTYRFLKNRGEK